MVKLILFLFAILLTQSSGYSQKGKTVQGFEYIMYLFSLQLFVYKH